MAFFPLFVKKRYANCKNLILIHSQAFFRWDQPAREVHEHQLKLPSSFCAVFAPSNTSERCEKGLCSPVPQFFDFGGKNRSCLFLFSLVSLNLQQYYRWYSSFQKWEGFTFLHREVLLFGKRWCSNVVDTLLHHARRLFSPSERDEKEGNESENVKKMNHFCQSLSGFFHLFSSSGQTHVLTT